TPGHIVARFPESEAIILSLTFKSRANQFADEPESEVRITFSGNFGDSSQKTRCGLIGLASFIARDSMTFHQSSISSSSFFFQVRSSLYFTNGNSASRVNLLSPCKFTSLG